jgi:GrpB-like predicted nucleotidyltransferase (UPF0157 family)
LAEIHHIGSTSIPGVYAKPIIDILPLVYDIAVVDSYNTTMEALGYQPKGEFGLPGRRYFHRGNTRRTHQVHVYQVGTDEAQRHLAFRDYLRAHPDKAQIYSDHKRDVARRHPYDIYAYMDAKDALVKQLEAEAVAWSRGREHDPLQGR